MLWLLGVLGLLASARMVADKLELPPSRAKPPGLKEDQQLGEQPPPAEACPLRGTLESALGAFQELRIPVMLAYGTAMGFAQSETLNCGDSGVDLAVFSSDLLKLGKTVAEQKARVLTAARGRGFRAQDPWVRTARDGTAATLLYRFVKEPTWWDLLLRREQKGLVDVYVLHADGNGGVWEFANEGRHFINRGRHFQMPASPAAFDLPASAAITAPSGVQLGVMPSAWLTAAYGTAWLAGRPEAGLTVHSDVFVNAKAPALALPSASYAPLGWSAQHLKNEEQNQMLRQRVAAFWLGVHRLSNATRRRPSYLAGAALLLSGALLAWGRRRGGKIPL